MQKNLEVKKTCHIFAIPKIKRSARITVSTQDSQSCNRSSILRPSTRKAPNHLIKSLLIFIVRPFSEMLYTLSTAA